MSFKHDVFVSYAHVDDQAPAEVERGWVSMLVTELKRLLAEQLGRTDSFSMWMDHALSGSDRVTPKIMDELQSSSVLLVVMSPGYLASEWCSNERSGFLAAARARAQAGGHLFIVEKTEVDRSNWPAEFADVLGYRFWRPDPDSGVPRTLGYPCPDPRVDRDYYRVIDDLAREMAAELNRVRAAVSVDTPAPEDSGAPSVSVFLATVTDDLHERREETKRYLEQQGIRVLPDRYYPLDPDQFREAMVADLADCTAFAQLLSPLSGLRGAGLEHGLPTLQYEIAMANGSAIAQWRSQDLDVDEVVDEDQRRLLDSAHVMAVPIEEFKEHVTELATRVPEPEVDAGDDLVFVNHSADDDSLGNQVEALVLGLGRGCSLPLFKASPTERRQDLERNLSSSDKVILLYGQSPQSWVREQLLHWHKLRARQRSRGRQNLAVCECPPPKDEGLRMRLPDMKLIDCRGGVNEAGLRAFLEESPAQ
jgi:hypothetical protein